MGISLRPNGMTSSAFALRYWERRQEVVSNNLANVSTDGFKAERAFANLIGGAVPEIDTRTDLRAGALRPTGQPLDLALGRDDAYLVIETADGERLSRGGSFRLDERGQVVTADGDALLGENGPIVLDAATAGRVREAATNGDGASTADPAGLVQIDREGAVHVAGAQVGTLRIETVPPGVRLAHAGGNAFVPPADRTPADREGRDVRQGSIEESNVSTVGSLVEMITVQRAYASVQKAMTTIDGVRGIMTGELGKPV